MNFINSFLLWTAAGAALPILIHMLNREKPKTVNIPTVKFIMKAVQKSSGSRKLNNLLLLFLRMMILIFISLIIARPQIEKFLSSTSEGPVQAVIVIDNSYYTAHKNTNGTLILKIKEKAKEIVHSLPSGSMISIMSAEKNDNEFTDIKEYAIEKIDQLSPAPVNAEIRSLAISANEMLKGFDQKTKRKIFIISDMNRGSWDSNYQLDGIEPQSIYLNPIPPRVGNVFISNVEVKGTGFSKSKRIFKRRETQILVKINGDRVLSGMKAKLIINGKDVDEKVLLTNEKESSLIFSTSFDKEGLYFCEVKIETQDSIDTDNIYYFNINVQEPLKIYLANDSKSINPLIYRAALSPSGWHGKQKFHIESLSYSRLQNKMQEEIPDLILLCGSLSLSSIQWNAITNYLSEGGKVLISPDKYTQFTELNQSIFSILKSKIIPVDKEVQLSLSASEEWRKLLDIPALLEVRAKHFFTYEEEPQTDKVEIPLRFSDGNPCLSVHKFQDGKIAFWGISPDSDFSDFISNNSFALLWHTLIEKLTETDHLQQNLFCGLPVEIFATKDEIKKIKIQSPAGTTEQLSEDTFIDVNKSILKSEFDQTFIPGHYQCNSNVFKGFSCNLERSPEYFQFPDKSEYEALITEKEEDKKESMIKSTFGPDGLLLILIISTLLFMVLEIHVGNRNYYAGD